MRQVSLSVDFLAVQQIVTYSLRVPGPCPRTEKVKKTTSGGSHNEIHAKKLASTSEHKLGPVTLWQSRIGDVIKQLMQWVYKFTFNKKKYSIYNMIYSEIS